MLSNNKVKNNDPLEIKTIDFSLVNMGEHISTPNTTLLDSKIDLLENKIEEQIQTNQVIMKKLNFDNMFNEKVDTIEEEVVNIKKNINELNKKLEEAELIRQIIEESISTILDAKLNEKTETSNDINKNILEVDLIVKENRMEINNLKQNLKILVNNEIELSIENKVNNIISNVVNDKINILLEENNKKILDSVSEMIKNEHKEDSSKEEESQRILEEEKKKEEEEAKRILEEEKKKEEEEEAKRILEEEKKKEEEEAKRILEEEKKKEEEEAKRILEEEKKKEEERVRLEEEKKAEEERKMEAEKQKEKEEFLKLFNDDIKIYPTTGYTMYLYIESEENLNKSEIGIFILKDGKYELRGKSSNFIDYDGKKLVVINVQLETNETSFVLSLKNNGSIIEPNNEIYNKFDILEIGKNNLTNNIEDIPTIKF